MPKIVMKFDGKPLRSASTAKIEPTYQHKNFIMANYQNTGKTATLSPYKDSLIRNEKMNETNHIRSQIKRGRVDSHREVVSKR